MGNFFGACQFSGNRYGTTPSHANLVFDYSDFALECQFKGSAAGALVNKYDNAASKGYKLEVLSTGVARATLNGTTVSAGSGLLNNAWHHLELNVNRSENVATLFADGVAGTQVDITSLGSTTNTSAFLFGIDPTLTTYLNGSLSEIRLSSGIRHTANFTPEVSALQDDTQTRLLYHFWEGKGATIYDMSASPTNISDAGVRHDATLVGGTGTWEFGPVLSNPVDIMEAAIWAALDTYSALTTWGSVMKLKRHRARRDDPITGRQVHRGLSRDDTPGVFVLAQVGPVTPINRGIHDVTVPVRIEGTLYKPTKTDVRTLWWLLFRAFNSREETDAGHFYHQQVQNWIWRPTLLYNLPETPDSTSFISWFAQQATFQVRTDFRVSGSP